MNTAFLLRFQEKCLPDDFSRIRSADPTVTEIAAEQPDVDSLSGDHRTFPSVSRHAGDPTKTAIDGEAPEEGVDGGMTALPSSVSVPRHAADPTHTLIKAEAPDESAECGMTALPSRTSAVCPTSTCTRTLAETNDTDFGHVSLHVLPRCS